MFCQNCGTQIPDGAKFCANCGASVAGGQPVQQNAQPAQQSVQLAQQSVQPVQQNVQPMQQNMQPVQMNYGQPGQVKKKGSGAVVGIIIAVVAVLLLGGAGAGYYVLKLLPVKKINEAVEAKDFNKVNELYDKVSSKEVKDNVATAMIFYADDIRDEYINEDISYDDAVKEYDVLKEKVLTDDKQLKADMEEIDKYEESRKLYSKASSQLDSKDYLNAIENYGKVIEEDSLYYDKAKKGIEACDKGITDMLIGRWRFDYNIGDVLEEELDDMAGDFEMSKLKLDFTYILEFEDDGGLSMDIDRKSLNEYVDSIVDIVVNSLLDEVYAEGVSGEEFSQYLIEEYGTDDFEAIMRREINSDAIYEEIKNEMNGFSSGGFKVENGILQMGDNDDMKYEFEGSDTLILGSESDKKTLEEAGLPYPFVLKRYDK